MAGTLTFTFAITNVDDAAATDAQIAVALGQECLRVVTDQTKNRADALASPVTLTSAAVA
jgi:hypothetical protein